MILLGTSIGEFFLILLLLIGIAGMTIGKLLMSNGIFGQIARNSASRWFGS